MASKINFLSYFNSTDANFKELPFYLKASKTISLSNFNSIETFFKA